ncbi:hypothetical protein CEXT_164141 [Caerostris extrusa]|uniref:Uncharacterized protein n=1 Tax=Caerostris extrusa TaxID=172846 RepID=A0AAV4P7X2_CAEEX|nr:hypothetical protein CEXT_164141 [Caerostris extrusa]
MERFLTGSSDALEMEVKPICCEVLYAFESPSTSIRSPRLLKSPHPYQSEVNPLLALVTPLHDVGRYAKVVKFQAVSEEGERCCHMTREFDSRRWRPTRALIVIRKELT